MCSTLLLTVVMALDTDFWPLFIAPVLVLVFLAVQLYCYYTRRRGRRRRIESQPATVYPTEGRAIVTTVQESSNHNNVMELFHTQQVETKVQGADSLDKYGL